MPKKKLSPAELVVERFGVGVRGLGELLDCDPSRISKWITRGGYIPDRGRGRRDTHRQLLDLAKKRKIELTADELVHGGEA